MIATNINMESTCNTISTFAPVVIPTLCRFEHFKDCIESLMKCTHADKTDVFIGLDFPAKKEHWEGYKKINDYLEDLKKNHKFKSLNIIKREKNYGIGANGNATLLVENILKIYDTYIFSEDDNVFSPAFLDYINKGLVKFKDDKTVFAINGYRHYYDIKFDDNTYYRQNVDFSAWGYGIWRDRIALTSKASKKRYWIKKAINPLEWYKVYNNGWNRVSGFLNMIVKNPVLNDNGYSIFMVINKMDVIMPKVSMVRNMGWDGSGEHCHGNNTLTVKHNSQILNKSKSFTYIGSGKEYYFENHKTYVKQSYGRITFKQFFVYYLKSLANLVNAKK